MAINKISGNILADNLQRGANLAIQGNLIYVDITNTRVGIKKSNPTVALDVSGNILASNISSSGIISASGNITGGNILAGSGVITTTGSITGASVVGGVITGTSTSVSGTTTAASVAGGVITGTSTSVSGTTTAASVVGGVITGTSTSVSGTTTAASVVGGVITGSSTSVTGTTTAASVAGGVITGSSVSATGNITGGNILVGSIVLPGTGNISVGNVNINNVTNPVANQDAATKFYVDNATGNVSGNVIGNLITLGTPTDGSLTANGAYQGWTTGTFVTDSIDDLNQVAFNIANNTFVGNTYITSNVQSGPSPLSVAFVGRYIGNPNSYLWDFGDGTTAATANANHTYSNVVGGQFTVVFTAYNTNGTYYGNAANGARGSTSTSTNSDYITLFTPTPIASFSTTPTSLDTGSSVTFTNTSLYATSYSLNYGDGNIVDPGNAWSTNSHTYVNSANIDAIYGIVLTATNQTAGNAPPYSNTSATTNVKVFTQQSPAFTANTTRTINYTATSGGVVSIRNDTPGSPGNTASFGVQQLYNFQWGDGTSNSNINIQTGLAGNPGAANTTHTFALSSVQQNAATTVSYTANLWLYTGFSTSPFQSSNVTIVIEPEVRANFVGTANTQSDATGYTSNAQVGYLATDYLGRDRSLFNFQNQTSPNVAFTGNVYNWTWGDTTSNVGITSTANITHSYQDAVASPTTGTKTVALQANGTPGTLSQTSTQTRTAYITILTNPTGTSNLSAYSNVTIATASQFTNAPLLAAGAQDNTGGNIVANGISVTRFATTTPIVTGTQVTNANTATTGTLTAFVNNSAAGNVTFTTGGNTVGTAGALIVSADRDLHVPNAAIPTGFFKVFSATISNTLASLGTGYNNYKFVHSTSGNTNYVGFVKDNLNSAPTLVTGNVAMTVATTGTYTYISGIPYFSSTGSPTITIANLEVQNLAGQTFCSATPFTLASGTNYEGSGTVIVAQTKGLATLNNAASAMLNGSNVLANIGISTNYIFANLTGNITGSNNSVATLQANLFNVIGTSSTVQLPVKIQLNAAANTGVQEGNIAVSATLGSVFTDAGLRINGFGSAANTPAFSGATNNYTSNVWTGVQTIAGTQEAVDRYGVVKHYVTDLSTGYLPPGPDLATGRSGLQYFTFAFRRATMANFDIRLTTTTGIAGLFIAAPGTTIDTSGFTSPTPGFPGPTSSLNGWLNCSIQYNGSGVPGANTGSGGNGSNGVALTGVDVVPLNSAIANVSYTMTLGSQNSSNSTGNNILVRIALNTNQTITALSVGDAA